MTNVQAKILAASIAALSMAGCVDVDPGLGTTTPLETKQQAVTVVPEFAVSGIDAVPDSLYLTELGLTVSEIRLEPVSTNTLAYSTREAMRIRFDLAGNETVREAGPIEVPHPGRYLVSIRLEPSVDDDGIESSLSARGFVVEQAGAKLGEVSDGEPQPMPFDEGQKDGRLTDAGEYPSEWSPFQYHSRRAVFYTFSDVEFEEGEQILTFAFDLRDWAVDIVEPISNAVSANDTDDDVDVTKQVDSSGTGAEALIETGVVRTVRRRP